MDTGEQLRDEGISRAVGHADAVCEDWSAMAYAWLERRSRYGGTTTFRLDHFTIEQLRLASVFYDIPAPPDPRAWGGIVRRAAKAGLIEATGEFRKAMNPMGHKRDVRVWRFK